MAITTSSNKSDIKTVTHQEFGKTFSAGDQFSNSGIYKCSKCNREIAANKHENTLPPHYPNDTCKSPSWQLYIVAEN